MNVPNSHRRLKRFYGDVARLQDREILRLVTGERILDVGCGFGALLHRINAEWPNRQALGIDVDQAVLKMASELYGVRVERRSVHDLVGHFINTLTYLLLHRTVQKRHIGDEGGLAQCLNQVLFG